MELSREFVERLSKIFFNEDMNNNQIENRLSDIYLNKEISDNVINDDLRKNTKKM
jgi:hypothetical protein